MNVEVVLRILAVGVFVFLAGPIRGAEEVRSPLKSNAASAEKKAAAAKTTHRHHPRRRHSRHRGWTHHLDPRW
jgi:hypothetical protein